MERASECSRVPHQVPALPCSSSSPSKKLFDETATSASKGCTDKQLATISVTPSWLNLSLDAALGCRASVFEIQKSVPLPGKKAGLDTRMISIHTQAVPSISK